MRLSAHLLLHEAMTTSASGPTLEKCINNLDLIWCDQRRCMAAILHDVRSSVAISPQHVREDICRKKIRLFASDHQNRNINSIPVFPEVHAIVPGITERVCYPGSHNDS